MNEYKIERICRKAKRENLIKIISEYSGDEFNTMPDIWDIAKEEKTELSDRIASIWFYHKELDNPQLELLERDINNLK